jgi:hypothetical protein
MTCQPAFSAEPTHPLNGDGPVFFRSCRNTSGAVSDTAKTTLPKPTPSALPPLVLTWGMRTDMHQAEARQRFREALLLARREALAATAKHLWRQRRCREASLVESELRAVTHEILAHGARQ